MSAAPSQTPQQTLRVWDGLVRLLHWALVISIAVSWWSRDDLGPTHENTGYVVIGILLTRLIWGFVGSRYARFAQFVRSPRDTLAYAHSAFKGHAPRYIGHNPLGGWMVVALLACLSLLTFTGWLYTTDMFWGYGWLAGLHKYLGWGLLVLVAMHIAGMLWTCFAHRENLIGAMFSGRKAVGSEDDVI